MPLTLDPSAIAECLVIFGHLRHMAEQGAGLLQLLS